MFHNKHEVKWIKLYQNVAERSKNLNKLREDNISISVLQGNVKENKVFIGTWKWYTKSFIIENI